jgi:hypothetical protein
MMRRVALVVAALVVAACGGSGVTDTVAGNPAGGGSSNSGGIPKARPQVVQPTAGSQAASIAPADPVGDPHAHAPPLSQIRHELKLALVYAPPTGAGYINPLRYVSVWERTDQGVDASMPVGSPILAPSRIKILAIEPDWYAGQPLVYWELLEGANAGKIQYVSEQITDIARPGSILQQGQTIARFAASGTGIEFGWSTINGVTLARATTGYVEGGITPAGSSIRAWLNALGANAGPDRN